MLNKVDFDTCKELKNLLSKFINLIDYRAFGSRVRGDNDADSDLDIFIEVEQLNLELKRQIQTIACEVGLERQIFISPLIFTKAEIEETPMRSSSLVISIKENGLVI